MDAEITELDEGECISCEEDPDPVDHDNYTCPNSKRLCGHHCNHSWTHEECCWCGSVFGLIEDAIPNE